MLTAKELKIKLENLKARVENEEFVDECYDGKAEYDTHIINKKGNIELFFNVEWYFKDNPLSDEDSEYAVETDNEFNVLSEGFYWKE